MQLLQWQPFPETGYVVVDGKRGAMVFAWDDAALDERCTAAALPAQRRRVIPEALLLPRGSEGVVLQPCTEGFEAQVWRDGDLIASRWWAERPAAAEWVNFQRGAGLPPEQHSADAPWVTPMVGPAPWLPQPWAEPRTLGQMQERERLAGQGLAGAMLLLLLAPTVWLAQALWYEHSEIERLGAERARLDEQARPLLQARAEALEALSLAETMNGAVQRTDALELLAHIARRLPADGSQIRELDWEGSRLRLVLGTPPTTPRITYVNALEGGGWLRGVREEAPESGTAGVGLVATLAGTQPPAEAESPPAPATAAPAAVSGAAR